MDISEMIIRLSNLSSFQGDEELGGAMEEICRITKQLGTARKTGGNLIITFGMPEAKRHILLDAHLDEISMVVTGINNKGFLRIAPAGGIDRRLLLGHEVTVWGREKVNGIICCQPPHLTSREDYKKLPAIGELAIDIGFSENTVRSLVSPGDKVSLSCGGAVKLLNGRITGKSLDNRAGTAVIIRAAQMLSDKILPDTKVSLLFSAQEETGERGAIISAYDLNPDEAIVVDVSYNLTPGCDEYKCGKMGEGPMLGVSPVLSRRMAGRLRRIAQQKGIPLQTEVMPELTGTNSDVISVSRGGIPTALLSIPLSYMHTAVEVIDPSDSELTANLIAEYILDGGDLRA